jgi:hypothetical protein
MAQVANTLAGLTLAQIAQRSLDALLPDLLPLKAFAADFSDEIAEKGGSVTTRYAPKVASNDLSTGWGNNKSNSQDTAVTVTLSTTPGYVIGFTDFQVSTIGIKQLETLFLEPARNAVNTGVMSTILALVTPGNFPNSSTIASPSADAISSLAAACDLSYMKKMGRYLLMHTNFNATLSQDTAIQAIYASGSGLALRENQVGRLSEFDTYKYTEVPGANNLVAIAASPDALIIAARQPAVPYAPQMQVENVTDPETGLGLQYRMWYDTDNSQLCLGVGLIFGAAVGNPGQLRRVVSA